MRDVSDHNCACNLNRSVVRKLRTLVRNPSAKYRFSRDSRPQVRCLSRQASVRVDRASRPVARAWRLQVVCEGLVCRVRCGYTELQWRGRHFCSQACRRANRFGRVGRAHGSGMSSGACEFVQCRSCDIRGEAMLGPRLSRIMMYKTHSRVDEESNRSQGCLCNA